MGSSDRSAGLFPFRIFAACLTAAAVLVLLCSCTDYERAGVNPRPFNEPTGWEQNPYGDAFRN